MSDSTSVRADPTAPAGGAIFLTPPPVQVVKDEDAATAVPLDTAKQLELCQKARAFTAETTALDGNWPAFIQKINSIEDMQASASVSSRMLDRPAAALNGGKGKAGNDAQSRVSNTLVDLRATVTEPDPNRADLQRVRKLANVWTTMGKLSEYNEFASALDTAVEEKIAELRAREKPRKQTCSSPTRCSGSGSVARTS